jgi:hypothetical protein
MDGKNKTVDIFNLNSIFKFIVLLASIGDKLFFKYLVARKVTISTLEMGIYRKFYRWGEN